MEINIGNILVATPLLNDTFFEKTIILITENNVNGTVGFVINKLHGQQLNNLVEFNDCKPVALYNGGPVENEKLYFIHNQPTSINNSTKIKEEIYFGGNFEQAVHLLNTSMINTSDIQIFLGYCGWDANELEAEIEEGSWFLYHSSMLTIKDLQRIHWESLYQNFQ